MLYRTPDISAMHHDETPDLKIVAEKLEDNLGVCVLYPCLVSAYMAREH
jgi:hypothetical protein